MPRLQVSYSTKLSSSPFGSKGTSTSKSWLSSKSTHAKYTKSNITETYAPKGILFQHSGVQTFFYESLRDALRQTDLAIVSNDSEQSLAIFGVKIYPSTFTVYPGTSSWTDNATYASQYKEYPLILMDEDRGIQLNSFGGHAFDNSTVLNYITTSGTAYNSNTVGYWGPPSDEGYLALEPASSLIPYMNRTFSSTSEGTTFVNDLKVTFMVYYNTDYVLVNYRGHGDNYELPLFCMIKGTIQNEQKTPVVYCCANPNDTRETSDKRNARCVQQKYTDYYTAYHTLVIPEYPDVPLMFNVEPTKHSTHVEARYSNSQPFFIDWRNANFQVQNLMCCNLGDAAPMVFFRKQPITGFSGVIQFSDNIIYADETCVNGSVYEIDGEQYWCPSNAAMERYISGLSASNDANYNLYNRRVLLKL